MTAVIPDKEKKDKRQKTEAGSLSATEVKHAVHNNATVLFLVRPLCFPFDEGAPTRLCAAFEASGGIDGCSAASRRPPELLGGRGGGRSGGGRDGGSGRNLRVKMRDVSHSETDPDAPFNPEATNVSFFFYTRMRPIFSYARGEKSGLQQ